MTDLWALLLSPFEDKSAPKGAKTAAAALAVAAALHQQLLLLLLQLHLLLAQLGLTAKPSYHPPRRLKLLQLHDRRRVDQHAGHRVGEENQLYICNMVF